MSTKITSPYEIADLYAEMGIDLQDLGCVMLDVEPIPIEEIVPPGLEDQLYFSSAFPYAQGAVGANTGHVTLRYGLITKAYEQREAVYRVLGDLVDSQDEVRITHVHGFPSPLPGAEPYVCIVGAVSSYHLDNANQALGLLPHIDTYPDYRPHVTLAYVKAEHAEEWIERLNVQFAGRKLLATGLNLGSPK